MKLGLSLTLSYLFREKIILKYSIVSQATPLSQQVVGRLSIIPQPKQDSRRVSILMMDQNSFVL